MKFLLLLYFIPIACGERIIYTNSGPIKGISLVEKGVEAFLGIPYAEPPVGPLRLSKPVDKKPWKDEYHAGKLPNACVQAVMGFLPTDPSKMSEDCLYLNLWVPVNENLLKPIMIFIHGGAFMLGSSNMDIYNGATLAARGDVIVATINFRVGTLGFFAGVIDEVPGNMGMYDQIMAIQWIKSNARHFGGDPDNIVLFGQSSGAISVSLFMISPLTKDLFRKAILQSGSAFHPVYSDKNEALFMGSQTIAKMLGCTDGNETLQSNPKYVLECMKNLPAKIFSDTDFKFFQNSGILLPRVGDELLPENPINLFRKREFKNNELLIGINRDEGPSFLALQKPEVFGIFGHKVEGHEFNETSARDLIQSMVKMADGNKIIQSYLERAKQESRYTYLNAMSDILGDYFITCSTLFQADHHSSAGNEVYFYLFDYRSTSSPRAEWMGVSHLDEIPYVFGNPFPKNFTEYEKELSNDIIDMWASFAKTGDPNIHRGLKWSPYTHENPTYFIIGRRDGIGIKPDNYRCERWRQIFRSSLNNNIFQTVKNSIMKMLSF